VPDDFYGEQVATWIQLHAGQTLTEHEVRAFCKERVAHYKIPVHSRFVSEFPMTVTGKLQKFRVRESCVAELAAAAPIAIKHRG
jgi:fatty-acyl-CoA synthase